MEIKKLVPTRRFKEFINADSWEQRKMGEIFNKVESGNRLPKVMLTSGSTPYIIAKTSDNGVYMYINDNTKDYHGNYMKKFNSGSITFSIDNPEAIFLQNQPFFTSNIMRVLYNPDINADQSIFILESLRKLTKSYNWSLKFSGPVVMNSNINMPIYSKSKQINWKEVDKIGNFISKLDNLITLHQCKLNKIKDLKSAYLSEMFPNEGECKPKRRFAGFTDAWEQRKLDEVADVRDGTHDSPQYFPGGHPFVTSKNVKDGYINYDDIKYISDNAYSEINKRSKVDINDILMGMIGTIGNIALVREKPDFAIKNVALIKDKNSVDHLYLYHYLQSPNIFKQLAESMDGGTQKFIALNKIRNLLIAMPSNDEQIMIGNYIENLDNLIILHQRKLEKLQNIKKAYLNEMFI